MSRHLGWEGVELRQVVGDVQAAPWTRRHIVQWQWSISSTGPVSSRAIASHRQVPLIIGRQCSGRTAAANTAASDAKR
jgi:hypothetical protein